MRIALIQDHLRNGGTENQTLHIANGLAKSGLETHVIIFRQGGVLDEKAASSDFTPSIAKSRSDYSDGPHGQLSRRPLF